MYSASQQSELVAGAKQLLHAEVAPEHLAQLKDILNFADWTYYVNDNPVLADAEYDALFKKLKVLEQHPQS